MKHVFRIALTVACLSVVAAEARADCNNPATDSERASCMAADLRQADDTINTVYQQLIRSISGTDRIALRDAQRAWIKFRDAQCGLNAGTGQRDAWLNQLLKDYQKAVCVTRVTNDRVAELQSMRQPAPQAGAKPTPSPAPRCHEPSITSRSLANALMACSALLLFHGTPSNLRNVNSLSRFFSKRSRQAKAA
jgi:uncharacterized protein YecT (DUF1311 family)